MSQIVKLSVFLAGGFCIACGCDFLGEEREREALLQQQRAMAEREELERNERSRAVRTFLNARCELVKEKYAGLEKELQELRQDAKTLEAEISRIVASGDEREDAFSYESRLLKILRSGVVNELAVKYLSGGFHLQAEEFISKVKAARTSERRYNEALDKSNEQFYQSIEESKGWVKLSREQRDAEIARLESEIDALEKRRKTIHREVMSSQMKGTTDSNRRRWSSHERVRDCDAEINKKRMQIDYLRNPDEKRKLESRAVERSQDVQRTAGRIKQERDYHIHRHLKPNETVAKVAQETSKATIDKLRNVIKTALEEKEREEQVQRKKLELAKEIAISLPVSDFSELNRLKARAEKEL